MDKIATLQKLGPCTDPLHETAADASSWEKGVGSPPEYTLKVNPFPHPVREGEAFYCGVIEDCDVAKAHRVWHTSTVKKIIEQTEKKVLFETRNSRYLLTYEN